MSEYKILQLKLKGHKMNGIKLNCKVNEKLENLRAELKRIETLEKTLKGKSEALKVPFKQGLTDEAKVIAWLKARGHEVKESTRYENVMLDIDCYVDGEPVSIKAEHSGLKYDNVYFELDNVLTSDGFTKEAGWYKKGKATKYMILQGTTLRCYKKKDIEDHVAAKGWLRVLPLSREVRATQGGAYRYCNTYCGYLMTDAVANESFSIV